VSGFQVVRRALRSVARRQEAGQGLRVYYDVRADPQPTVEILAIGVKDRNEVRIGGKAVKL